MEITTFLPFIFLSISIFSVWFKRDPRIWGLLTGLAVFSGLMAGNLSTLGLFFVFVLSSLWIIYSQKPTVSIFIAIVLLSLCTKFRLIFGFNPIYITSKFALGLENPLIGLFPLALIVPLAQNSHDVKLVSKNFAYGVVGVLLIAFIAIISGAIGWHVSLPTYLTLRLYSNLVFTSIPEEAFFRGFVQRNLNLYLNNSRFGKIASIVITSLLFTLAHIFWSSNLAILAFTFIVSLLYGTIYAISEKIESAILTHFLLNVVHMTLFTYHAM